MPERVGHEGRLSGVVAWGAALTSTRANQTSPVRPRLRLAPKDHSTVCLDCVAGICVGQARRLNGAVLHLRRSAPPADLSADLRSHEPPGPPPLCHTSVSAAAAIATTATGSATIAAITRRRRCHPSATLCPPTPDNAVAKCDPADMLGTF